MFIVAELIEQPPSLATKVSYGPDGVDDQVLSRADTLAEAIQAELLGYLSDDANDLERQLEAAAGADDDTRLMELVITMKRAIALRDQSDSYGYSAVAKKAEDLIHLIKYSKAFSLSEFAMARSHVSALRQAIDEQISGDNGKAGALLMQGLEPVEL